MMIDLEPKDWEEIHAALNHKHAGLLAGDFGETDENCNIEEWIAHIDRIMTRLEEADIKG